MWTYGNRFHAVGQLLDQRKMRRVCVTETPEGVVIFGEQYIGSDHHGDWVPITLTLSDTELATLMRADQPGGRRLKLW